MNCNPCFDHSDTTGRNSCSITKDTTTTYNEKNNLYAIVDGNGYPFYSQSMKLGYSESTAQNLVGCVPSSMGKGSGSCYDSNGSIITGYKACTAAECKPVIYDNSFPLNQCNLAYVTVEGNYKPDASCSTDHYTACIDPECNPPCVNGGVCTTVDNKTFCDCSTAFVNFTDCHGSCRGTPTGRTWTFQYSGDTCESPPTTGLPDDFVTFMKHHHDGETDFVCNSRPFEKPCQNGETTGVMNQSDWNNWRLEYLCSAQGMICGANTDQRTHATGADQGNCNC
jgi:hypothetical protein